MSLPTQNLGDYLGRLLVGLLIVLGSSHAAAGEMYVNAAEIVGYGIFDSRQIGATSYGGASIPQDRVENVRFIGDFTNEIPAVLGTEFGFQYLVNSTPRGRSIDITYVIKFPEPGLKRPSGKVYKETRYQAEARIGHRSLHGYGFDRPWEMVPGDWVFEVWHRKAMLIRKTFTVLRPTGE